MSKDVISVYFEDQIVGTLYERETGLISFQYSNEWQSESGFPISHSMPLRPKVYDKEAQNFFGNLLPEGDVRLETASSHGISSENDYRLLVAIGGECAGALTIGKSPQPLKSDYKRLDLHDIERRYSRGETLLSSMQETDGEMVDGQPEVRLSLAGAQDKLPVYVSGEALYLPSGNSPSTHILKLPSHRFAHLSENETLMNHFANAMGLEVAPTRLLKMGSINGCLVERYDRYIDNGKLRRAHQEDFCQALNFSFRAKYEKDSGPTFASCYSCLETTTVRMPDDLERLVRWLIFNVVIGNCDAHAKNISLLLKPGREWELSPHYDLVSTRVYKAVSKELAMSIGGTRDSGTITGTHWAILARTIRFGTALIKEMVDEMATKANVTFDETVQSFVKTYGNSAIVQPLKKVIHEQTRRMKSQLAK